MFCHQCGTQSLEGAEYCQKCGTKLLSYDSEQENPATFPQSLPNSTAMNEQNSNEQVALSDLLIDDFRNFVDNHVRATTRFQSATNLLENSTPFRFVWICMGIAILVGLVLMGPLGILIFGLLFGYVATFIAGGIIRTRYKSKFSGSYTGDINIDDLLAFLSTVLIQIHPYFHEWGYLSKEGLIPSLIENPLSGILHEIRICSEFGAKKKHLITLYIKPKSADATSNGKAYYNISAIKNGVILDWRADGFHGHGSLIRTAPILQASMEYYLLLNDLK
jgi:hypothetical protein